VLDGKKVNIHSVYLRQHERNYLL